MKKVFDLDGQRYSTEEGDTYEFCRTCKRKTNIMGRIDENGKRFNEWVCGCTEEKDKDWIEVQVVRRYYGW